MVERTEVFTGLVHLVQELKALGLELLRWNDSCGALGLHGSEDIGIDRRR